MTGTIRYLIDEDGTCVVHADLGDSAAEIAALAESARWLGEAGEVRPTAAVLRGQDPGSRRMQAALRLIVSGGRLRRAEVTYAPDPEAVEAGVRRLLPEVRS
jgi:hypothetical protein